MSSKCGPITSASPPAEAFGCAAPSKTETKENELLSGLFVWKLHLIWFDDQLEIQSDLNLKTESVNTENYRKSL